MSASATEIVAEAAAGTKTGEEEADLLGENAAEVL